jgi:hypothetical protein
MKIIPDITYKEGLMFDLYLPVEGAFDLFIWFHGGGLEWASRKAAAPEFAESFCNRGVAVASVEYRMYPNAEFPDYIVDSAESVRYLFDHIKEYGDCRRIFVGGTSAGGYLSMMLCFDRRYFEAVGLKPTDIDGYIHDAGQPTVHFNILAHSGEDSKRVIVDERAPLYFIGRDEKYSPMLFLVSDDDIFARLEQIHLTVKTLEHFGHKDNIYLKEQHGKHCKYTETKDENGVNIFATLVCDFIETL